MDRYSNLAISRIDDGHYTKNQVYECSQVYKGMIDILDNNDELITHDANTDDFLIVLNVDYTSNQWIRDMKLLLI